MEQQQLFAGKEKSKQDIAQLAIEYALLELKARNDRNYLQSFSVTKLLEKLEKEYGIVLEVDLKKRGTKAYLINEIIQRRYGKDLLEAIYKLYRVGVSYQKLRIS